MKTPTSARLLFGGRRAFSFIAAAALFASTASAATLDWNPTGGAGGDGIWSSTATNWFDGTSNVGWTNSADVANFLSFTGSNEVTLGALITVQNLTLASGTGDVTLKDEALTVNGTITGQTTRTLRIESDMELAGTGVRTFAGIIDIAGVISGSAQLWSSTATNVITLRSANINTAGVFLRDGTLELGHDNALGTGALRFGDSEPGTPTLRAINGPRTIANDILSFMRAPQFGSGFVTRTLDGDLTFTGNLSISRNNAGTAGLDQLYVLNTVNGTSTFTGNVTSNGDADRPVKLVKRGSGTLVFDHASNTASTAFAFGGVLVEQGTLLINSPFNDQDNYVIGGAGILGNATLGGTSTISLTAGKSVTVQGTATHSATIAPGNSVGTLTINGDVIFGDYSVFSVEVDGATSDLLVVGGDLNLSSSLNTLTIVGTLTAETYTIATYSGALTGTFATITGLGDYFINYGTGSDSEITLTAIPEPAHLGAILAAFCLAGVVILRRRIKA